MGNSAARLSAQAFEVPDWSAPYDALGLLDRTPPDAKIRGMLCEAMLELLEPTNDAARPGLRTPYLPFEEYPLVDFMALALDAAARCFPDHSIREGLRRVGAFTHRRIRDTMLGRALAATPGFDASLRAAAATYGKLGGRAHAEVVDFVPGVAIISMRNVHSFVECMHVGMWEANLQVEQGTGQIQVRVLDPHNIDLKLLW